MADFPPPSDPKRSADLRRRLLAGIPRAPITPPALDPAARFDDAPDSTVPWSADDALRLEMEKLQASLSANGPAAPPAYPDGPDYGGGNGYPEMPTNPGRDVGRPTPIPGALPNFSGLGGNDSEMDRLRSENAELTRLLEEMKPILEEASNQERACQALIEEKKTREQEFARQIEEREGQV